MQVPFQLRPIIFYVILSQHIIRISDFITCATWLANFILLDLCRIFWTSTVCTIFSHYTANLLTSSYPHQETDRREWDAFLLNIREVPSWNIGQMTGCPHWHFMWFVRLFQEMPGQYFNWAKFPSVHVPSSSLLTNLLKPTGLHDAPTGLTFNNCTLCPHCIYMFCMYLKTNSDLCHLHHKLIGFYNRDEKCLQRGTDWVFK